MSNINTILSELNKANESASNLETLPFSKKEVKIPKPTIKLQQDITKLIENYKDENETIVEYIKYISQYVSNITGSDINLIDKNYFLFSMLNKLTTKADENYSVVLDKLSKFTFDNILEQEENGISFKFKFDIPTIEVENKFIKYLSKKSKIKITDYGFVYIFKYVSSIILNNKEDHTIEISETDVDSLYKIYLALPYNTCNSLTDFVMENITTKILDIQNQIDIEQDPSIFVSL